MPEAGGLGPPADGIARGAGGAATRGAKPSQSIRISVPSRRIAW